MNPLSDVMGGWGIWETVNGERQLTTECIENVILMMPFTGMVMWMFDVEKGVVWKSTKLGLIFSVSIEMLQLLLRLGTFQVSDIVYNTLGGMLGGLCYKWERKYTKGCQNSLCGAVPFHKRGPAAIYESNFQEKIPRRAFQGIGCLCGIREIFPGRKFRQTKAENEKELVVVQEELRQKKQIADNTEVLLTADNLQQYVKKIEVDREKITCTEFSF